MQILNLWIINPKETLEAISEYSGEIKQTPDLRHFPHKFNIMRRLAKKIQSNKIEEKNGR